MFAADTLLIGNDQIVARGQANTGLAGCLDCGREFGWDITHAVSAHAGPSGPVTTEAFQHIVSLIVDAARAEKPDGVLLCLHGAMVPEFCRDGEGEVLARLRDVIARTLRAHRPMLGEANGGRTDIGPMIERIARARAYESEPNVFAVSINAGFEESDIPEIGPTVFVTCQGDGATHQAFAETIADDIWQRRAEYLNTYYTVEEVADIAATYTDPDAP